VSAFGDVFAALRTALELTSKVEAMSKTVDRLAIEMRDLDRRLVRVETIIEVTRTDGAVLRIAKNPEAGGQSTED
jgi:hypothetical protein